LRPFPETTPQGDSDPSASTHLQKVSAVDLHNLSSWNDGMVE
jgi:hypothetical protein